MDDTGLIAPTWPVADGRVATATGRSDAAPVVAAALAATGAPASEAAFERALSGEIVASELIRVRVLSIVLALLLLSEQLLFLFGHDLLEQVTRQPVSIFLPLRTMGPFVLYEALVLYMLGRRVASGRHMPRVLRFVNAAVETSLPTVILW